LLKEVLRWVFRDFFSFLVSQLNSWKVGIPWFPWECPIGWWRMMSTAIFSFRKGRPSLRTYSKHHVFISQPPISSDISTTLEVQF
jgi:hypothetical protein